MIYTVQKLFCPVHPKDEGYLGSRNKAVPFEGFCDDCQHFYWFPPYKTIPTKNQSKKSRDNACKCPGCRWRDAKSASDVLEES